jgi:hypothetical protein
VYLNVSNYCRPINDTSRWSVRWQSSEQRQPRRRERSGAAGGRRHARKTAKAPVLMAEAWARTPSITRTGMSRPVCEAARSAAADSPCLGSGSATKTLAHACIGRLSVVAGTARARWCSPFAVVCWAEVHRVVASEADRGLGPMLPASARERWPFCVLRDSCHAALPDQSGLPQIGSGRWTGGSRRRPRALRIATDGHCIDAAGAGPCRVGVLPPARQLVSQTALLHARPKMVLC